MGLRLCDVSRAKPEPTCRLRGVDSPHPALDATSIAVVIAVSGEYENGAGEARGEAKEKGRKDAAPATVNSRA